MTQGTLFVVATPIGNLSDLSPRARQVLAEVDLVAAEDTRHTGRLLSHFGIETPQFALHEHNEREAVTTLVAKVRDGRSIALVSDAGTPLVSDPGYRLVLAAHAAGIPVSPVPGPSAVVAALSAAGLPTDRFCFEGFLPARGKSRRTRLESLRFEPRTMVFYVPVHRVRNDLADCADVFGAARDAFAGRELSKLHEQCVAAPLGELLAMVEDGRLAAKGEYVIVVAGSRVEAPRQWLDEDRLLDELAAVLPGKQAVAIVAAVSGRSRNALYRKMLAIDRSDADDGAE
ncbi:MAG: 16S rRNA (cytidine(1402)-2'-O)-methyltransferase [Woeseiaceae bacterium]